MQLGSPHTEPRRDASPLAARLKSATRFALGSFGPLFMFWLGQYFGGALLGIAGTVIWCIGHVLYRLSSRKTTSRLFWLTTVLTLVFGSFDLALGRSVFFRFEAVLTNLLTALYFGLSMATGKSVLEEFYEKSQAAAASQTPELKVYLRLCTGVWGGYFLLKSGLYYWLALALPLAKLIVARSIVGNVSMVALLGAERLLRMRVFRYLKAQGHLGTRPTTSTTTR